MPSNVGKINAVCPECKGMNGITPSTLPGFARCGTCGFVFAAKREIETAEAVADEQAERELIVPDQVAVEYGWRAWGIKKKETDAGLTLLQSVSAKANAAQKVFWQPFAPMEAVCEHDHEVPGDTCSCGLYSAKTLDHLMTMPHYLNYDFERNNMFKVMGKVALWGKVIEGSQGWKATYGYPVELYLPFEAWHLHNDLRESYGVPIYLKNFLRGEE